MRAFARKLLELPRGAAWLLCLAWFGLIWWMSSQPGSREPVAWWVPVLSNGAHAPVYGLFACWLALVVPRREGWPVLTGAKRAGLLVAIVVLGVVDELHQSSVPGRDLSVLDVVTDLVGAAVSLEIVAFLGREPQRPGGLARRLVVAALASIACGALATWVPVCFPGIGWF